MHGDDARRHNVPECGSLSFLIRERSPPNTDGCTSRYSGATDSTRETAVSPAEIFCRDCEVRAIRPRGWSLSSIEQAVFLDRTGDIGAEIFKVELKR